MDAELALKLEALFIGVVMLTIGIAISLFLFDRYGRRSKSPPKRPLERREPDMPDDRLEERVRVLERIATDARTDLASEIEGLRETAGSGKGKMQ